VFLIVKQNTVLTEANLSFEK